jgi:hypothetical protein
MDVIATDVRENIECPLPGYIFYSVNGVESLDSIVDPLFILSPHLLDEVPSLFKGNYSCFLE